MISTDFQNVWGTSENNQQDAASSDEGWDTAEFQMAEPAQPIVVQAELPKPVEELPSTKVNQAVFDDFPNLEDLDFPSFT